MSLCWSKLKSTKTSERGPLLATVPLKPERMAQLEDYAHRHGKDPAAALDDVLAEYLDWERQDYQQAVEGIRQGYADVKAGRTQLAEQAFEALREKHGLPR
jgi:predicted transcriptional regulator